MIIFVILAILIGGSVWGNRYITTSTQKLVQTIEQVDERLDNQDWDQANVHLQLLKKDWVETKDVWSVLVHHQEIDTIDIAIMRLTEYFQANNSVLAAGELATLRLLYEHIADTESFNLKNIF
ncbi:DUF4363 family protein [Desulfitobacterium metallireducens]|nr:DUF4363 family protein [Desulfitobacterium metallireducens]